MTAMTTTFIQERKHNLSGKMEPVGIDDASEYFDHADEGHLRGWRNIHVTDSDHPYMKHWWVPGLQIGYEHTFTHQFADFVCATAKTRPAPPTFRDGLATDRVTDAVLASARSGRWEGVRT